MALPTISDLTLYVNKVLTGKDWNKNFQAILKWFTDGTTDIKVKSVDIPATGNITNAGTLVQTGASQFSSDVAITGNLTATGNIAADKFVGDGSLLTNLVVSGLANYTPFTVNSGNLDANGDGEILSFEVGTPETLNFKVGTPYANLVATRADSTTFTLTEISDISVASLTNGTYTICVLKDVIIAEVCGTVFRQKIAPVTAQQDDIWLDTSTELIKSYKYDTGFFVAYDGVPIGTVTVNTGVCTAVETFAYNYNGYNVNNVTASRQMTIGWIPPDISTASSVLSTSVQTADINMWLYVRYNAQDDYAGATVSIGKTNPPTQEVFRAHIMGAAINMSGWIFVAKGYYYQYSGQNLGTMTKYACIGE